MSVTNKIIDYAIAQGVRSDVIYIQYAYIYYYNSSLVYGNMTFNFNLGSFVTAGLTPSEVQLLSTNWVSTGNASGTAGGKDYDKCLEIPQRIKIYLDKQKQAEYEDEQQRLEDEKNKKKKNFFDKYLEMRDKIEDNARNKVLDNPAFMWDSKVRIIDGNFCYDYYQWDPNSPNEILQYRVELTPDGEINAWGHAHKLPSDVLPESMLDGEIEDFWGATIPLQPPGRGGNRRFPDRYLPQGDPKEIHGGDKEYEDFLNGSGYPYGSGSLRGEVKLAPNQQVGIAPNQQVGMAPNQQVGMADNQQVGMAPNQEVGIKSNQNVGVRADAEVGIRDNQQVGLSPNQEVGIKSNQTVGVTGEVSLVNKGVGTAENPLNMNIKSDPENPIHMKSEVKTDLVGLVSLSKERNIEEYGGKDASGNMVEGVRTFEKKVASYQVEVDTIKDEQGLDRKAREVQAHEGMYSEKLNEDGWRTGHFSKLKQVKDYDSKYFDYGDKLAESFVKEYNNEYLGELDSYVHEIIEPLAVDKNGWSEHQESILNDYKKIRGLDKEEV